MNITWGDLARMIVYSDQTAAVKAANAAMAEALPGYEWAITSDPDDPLDRTKIGLEARPTGEAKGEALCPEGVRTAVWARDPEVPDPMLPLIAAYIVYRDKFASATTGDDKGEVSDGYHTFNELYEHRYALFLALIKAAGCAWACREHEDGSPMYEGYFIAGMDLDGAQISYHLPMRFWSIVEDLGIVVDKAPKWDGHTSDEVVARLMLYASRSDGLGRAAHATPQPRAKGPTANETV